ncbi:HNH endonuclease [Pseudoalteromonas sp. S4389]|uniref:HNH endonuclease n=1 Tax=Pseudoalteromonas sp. S4389 TaxID=579556 RepID=UPI001486AC01|nr:HNH endonuclease [Pseudoalteromonas sp. S4389]
MNKQVIQYIILNNSKVHKTTPHRQLVLTYLKGIYMKLFIFLSLSMISISSAAHSGRTNSEGCHNDRKNGGYHCHGAKTKSYTNKSTLVITPTSPSVLTSYNRKDWPHWVDADSDCQDTRAEILIRDSRVPVKFKRNKGCNVSWGEWLDPYTLQVFTKASDLDIDHVVPLAHAHETGAANWTREQKRSFANDFENLLAVEDNSNQAKGAKSPLEWMPKNKAFHCEYLIRWRAIKLKYNLKITIKEAEFLVSELSACED